MRESEREIEHVAAGRAAARRSPRSARPDAPTAERAREIKINGMKEKEGPKEGTHFCDVTFLLEEVGCMRALNRIMDHAVVSGRA